MALLTKTQLRDAIKREARQQSTNDLDTMIYEIMDGVLNDMLSKERAYEMKVIGSGTACANATATINLPGDFMHVDEVRFSTDSGVTQQYVFPKNDFSKITTVGTPKWWQIVGTTLYFFPYSLVTTSHKIYLDYYKTPTFASDSDNFPVLRFQEPFKKECVQRLLEYVKELDQAERMGTSADKSMSRAKDANREGRGRDSVDTREPAFGTVPEDTK